MRKKMFLVFFIILVFVFVMIGRIFAIEMRSGEKYEKIVLQPAGIQQPDDSVSERRYPGPERDYTCHQHRCI